VERKITKLPLAPQVLTRQRTAAYARVSCAKDEMLHSLAAQVSFYSNLIQSRADWEYVGVYADVDAPYGQNVKARECLILSALTGSSFFN